MICELAITAALGMKHDGIPMGTIVFGCYGHMWLRYRYRQVSENSTHDIQTHLIHQGTFCLVLRS